AIKVARHLEKFVRPRLGFLGAGPGMLRLIGLGIVIASLGLMVAIAHSVLEQHSSLGSSAFSHRNDGERRPVRATWPCNRSGYLGFYWSRHRAYCWRFPEAIGFFSSLMKIDFITALASPSPRSPHRNLLHGTYLGSWNALRVFKN